MSILEFIVFFFISIFLGSLAVTGWYFITRGEEKELEDGSKKKVGKIFKGWFFFWMKTKPEKKRVYFDEAHLYELYLAIRPHFEWQKDKYHVEQIGKMLQFTNAPEILEKIKYIEHNFKVKFFHKGDADYSVYKEYDEFVYPEWVRDPLAKCATCFSSLYGSTFYWLLIALIRKPVFEWSNTPWLAAVGFWIAFCFSLSVVNTALAKRFN